MRHRAAFRPRLPRLFAKEKIFVYVCYSKTIVACFSMSLCAWATSTMYQSAIRTALPFPLLSSSEKKKKVTTEKIYGQKKKRSNLTSSSPPPPAFRSVPSQTTIFSPKTPSRLQTPAWGVGLTVNLLLPLSHEPKCVVLVSVLTWLPSRPISRPKMRTPPETLVYWETKLSKADSAPPLKETSRPMAVPQSIWRGRTRDLAALGAEDWSFL